MAVTVTRSRYNIFGSGYGVPNPVVYVGPELDMTLSGGPINAANTIKVWRQNEMTGAWESYVPGVGGDFTTLDRGTLMGAASGMQGGLGRGYLVIAKADFVLPHSIPGG